ncbi:hypothetical protein UP09_28280 [Bradyrhizobium sp. LTSP885]|nr:hypothetical protein UP09_28280 [Bradyrhizobium sp. LTSP885]
MIKKRMHDGHTRTKGAFLQAEVFTTALVVTYVGAFIDPTDWERTLLDLAEPTDKQRALHQSLKNMRNQLFAHSDLRHFDITPGRIGQRRFESVGVTYFELKKHQIELLRDYIIGLIVEIHRELNVIADAHLPTGTDSVN